MYLILTIFAPHFPGVLGKAKHCAKPGIEGGSGGQKKRAAPRILYQYYPWSISYVEFLQQNLLWVALAAVSGAWLLIEFIRQQRDKSQLTPVEATLLINREDAITVDVRVLADYEKGHLPNARHLPLTDFERRGKELEKFRARPLILYCNSGITATKGIAALKKAGFEKLYNLRGGIYEWEKAGYPITRKKK